MNPTVLMIVYMLLGVALIVGGYLLIRLIARRRNAPQDKEAGADTAVAAARRFARSNGFVCLAPAKLTGKGRAARLDAVVIGYFGVLGVKAYGFNGEIYGAPGEEEWLQVSPGGERRKFANPVNEANADVRVLRDVLFTARLKNVPVEVLCVFTDPKAQMAVSRGAGVFTLKAFKAQLEKDKYLEDKGFEPDKVRAALEAAMESGGQSGASAS